MVIYIIYKPCAPPAASMFVVEKINCTGGGWEGKGNDRNVQYIPLERTREETVPSRGPPARTKRVETAKTGFVDYVIVYNLSRILYLLTVV